MDIQEVYRDKQIGNSRKLNFDNYIKYEIIKVLPKPNATHVEDNTFMMNNYIKIIYFDDSITQIGIHAFSGCHQLNKVYLPKQLKYLDICCFLNCDNLISINLYDKLYEINDRCFQNCNKLEKIKIPNSVNKLGKHAFDNCLSLNEIILSEKLEEIKAYTFLNCINLKKIKIPNSVKKIALNAFCGCKLDDIILPKHLEYLREKIIYLNKS